MPRKKGYKHTSETKEKLRVAFLGRKFSPETIAKMSISQRGRKHNPETRIKIIKAWTPELREKIAESNRNREIKPETRKKHSERMRGSNNHRWTGGRQARRDGYVQIWSPNHPNKDGHGYIMEHRLVMEARLGRFLSSEEVVHHINEIRDDNRDENLFLFPNMTNHLSFHKRQL